MSSFVDLPEELINFILLHMIPDTLTRLKFTNKRWFSRIDDPKFVAEHLKVSKLKPHMLFSGGHSCRCREKNTPKCFNPAVCAMTVSTLLHERVSCDTRDLNAPSVPREFYTGDTTWRAHCDGVFCLASNPEHRAIVVCNPAIGESVRLPRLRRRCARVGFGYDPKSKTYKVVALLRGDNFFGSYADKAVLFCLGSDSWRDIVLERRYDFDTLNGNYDNGVYLNGVYYWLSGRNICSFDMSNEVFREVPGPELSEDKRCNSLTVWDGSLAVFCSRAKRRMCDNPIAIEVWVMDANSAVSWRESLAVGGLSDIKYPLGFWGENSMIMRGKFGMLVLYDAESKKLWNLPNRKTRKIRCWSSCYIQSLVSVRSNNWWEIQN